jgi:hypothetical protein
LESGGAPSRSQRGISTAKVQRCIQSRPDSLAGCLGVKSGSDSAGTRAQRSLSLDRVQKCLKVAKQGPDLARCLAGG